MNGRPKLESENGQWSVRKWVQRAAVRVSVRHQDRFMFLRGTVADSGIKLLGSIDENQHVST